jgi:acyl-coenzyme A synthetase/AMP-(fatty) acid ligase
MADSSVKYYTMHIPDRFNFVEQLFKQSANYLFNTALIDTTQSWTYQELETRVKSLSTWLTNSGVRPEERVAIVLKDSADTAAILLAVMYSGMVAVPIDPRSSLTNIRYCVDHSGARLVIKENDLEIGGVDKTDMCNQYGHELACAYSSHRDSACIFMYTSGTTGHPKAVVHCHRALITIGTRYGVDGIGVKHNDVMFGAPKLFFSFGLLSLWTALTAGASLVLNPGIFIPGTVAEMIVKFGVTIMTAVPVLYGKLLEQPLVGHQLRLCLSGGDRLPESVCHLWLEKTQIHLRNIYGSTETGTAFMYNSGNATPGSIGQPIAGYELDVRDEQLWVRAPSAGLCYWHDKYWSERQFGEWMPTGDIVSQDAQGNYYFLGRVSDVIKVNGNYVDLGKIEQAVMSVPGVQEAVVIGKTDKLGHARLKSYIVTVPTQQVTPVDILKHVKEFEILDQLPRTETGKIQRYKLREGM